MQTKNQIVNMYVCLLDIGLFKQNVYGWHKHKIAEDILVFDHNSNLLLIFNSLFFRAKGQ
jgi:hypothetical protein